MKPIALIIISLFVCAGSFAQEWPLKRMIEQKKTLKQNFNFLTSFKLPERSPEKRKEIYEKLILNDSFINKIYADKPNAIRMDIPADTTIQVELIKADLGINRFLVNNKQQRDSVNIPICYRGVVTGETGRNNVILTVNKEYVSLIITHAKGAIQITKGNETQKNLYRLYNSEKNNFSEVLPIDCGTIDKDSSVQLTTTKRTFSSSDKCVYVYVECLDSLYIKNKSNYQQTINYVYELFNAVATGYLNEQINVKISAINVWTKKDPFRYTVRDTALQDIADYYKDNYWGNIGVVLDFSGTSSGRSGKAGGIGVVKGEAPNSCVSYSSTQNSFCYNDLNYNVNVKNFPTGPNISGPQVYLVMHEMGHLLGSFHTKWCGWLISNDPITYGALDSCGVREGECSQGPAPPSSGATIMSYCVTGTQFVNFNNGFGKLPGDAIRNFVDKSPCIFNCPVCPSTINIGNIGVGVSHFEASSFITANGVIQNSAFTTLDGGIQVKLVPGFKAENGSQVKIINDGCGGIR